MDPLKVLFIGDVVGKLGRRALQETVPQLRSKHNLDLVIANVENLAHGKGITKRTFAEIQHIGIDAYTSGNHVWTYKEGIELLQNEENQILRPLNYPEGVPGQGSCVLNIRGRQILLINLIGRVFMKDDFDDPFRKFDQVIQQMPEVDEVIVDLHAEASSEKKAFAWYVAGRASLVVGTHTHIPTADAALMSPHNLGYVTDIGMVGAQDSVLGVAKEEIIHGFLTQLPVKHKMIERGTVIFNSILAELKGYQSIQITRVDLIIEGR